MTTQPAAAGRRPRGPYAKSGRTRQHIVDSARTVFAESGYRSGSLRDVARHAGISESGLLHHFSTKRELLSAVLRRRDDETQQWFDRDLGPDRGLAAMLVALVDHNACTPTAVELFCTLVAEATSPAHPAHPYFSERYERTVTLLQQAFEDLEGRGRLRTGVSAALAARGAIALMDGLQIQWLLAPDSVDMATDLRAYLRAVLADDA